MFKCHYFYKINSCYLIALQFVLIFFDKCNSFTCKYPNHFLFPWCLYGRSDYYFNIDLNFFLIFLYYFISINMWVVCKTCIN